MSLEFWTFDLAVNGKSNWTFWLRLPDAAGPVNLHAVIEAGYTPASLEFWGRNT